MQQSLIYVFLVAIILTGLPGCDSSNSTNDNTKVKFIAVHPPISRPDPGGITGQDLIKTQSEKTRGDSTPLPMNMFFYLVNGANTTTDPLNVLTVIDNPPAGAPSPNAGSTANIQPMGAYPAKQALWKAVPVSGQDGKFFLRSATSFITRSTTATDSLGNYLPPNLLLGFGSNLLALDFGYAAETIGTFMNQGAATGNHNTFQMWSYTDDGQLVLASEGQNLIYTGEYIDLSSQTGASATWYTVPDYYINYVVSMNATGFPSFDPYLTFDDIPNSEGCDCTQGNFTSSGQQAAYEYISIYYMTDTPPSDENYGNIRGIYIEPGSSAITECVATVRTLPNPGSHTMVKTGETVTISDADFNVVSCQLYYETFNVGNVDQIFQNYTDILNTVFNEQQDELQTLYNQLNMATTAQVTSTPLKIIEDTLLTAVRLIPAAGGALAGVMSMGFNYASGQSASGATALHDEMTVEVDNLYTELNKKMTFFSDPKYNGENAILTDWEKLKRVGPMLTSTNYNSFRYLSQNKSEIVNAAVQGFIAATQSVLIPSVYALSQNWGLDNDDPFGNITTSQEFSYPTFGSTSGSWNVNYFYENNEYNYSQILSQSVIDTCTENGVDKFEMFNGLNSWSNTPLNVDYAQTNIGGAGEADNAGTVITAFNQSATPLYVVFSPSEGLIAAPGWWINTNPYCAYTSDEDTHGSENPYTVELRPYGYATMYVAANSKNEDDLDINVSVMDSSNGEYIATGYLVNDGLHCNISPMTTVLQPTDLSKWQVKQWDQTNCQPIRGWWFTIASLQ